MQVIEEYDLTEDICLSFWKDDKFISLNQTTHLYGDPIEASIGMDKEEAIIVAKKILELLESEDA